MRRSLTEGVDYDDQLYAVYDANELPADGVDTWMGARPCIDLRDHHLDMTVEQGWTWHSKDEAELDAAVDQGRFTTQPRPPPSAATPPGRR